MAKGRRKSKSSETWNLTQPKGRKIRGVEAKGGRIRTANEVTVGRTFERTAGTAKPVTGPAKPGRGRQMLLKPVQRETPAAARPMSGWDALVDVDGLELDPEDAELFTADRRPWRAAV